MNEAKEEKNMEIAKEWKRKEKEKKRKRKVKKRKKVGAEVV